MQHTIPGLLALSLAIVLRVTPANAELLDLSDVNWTPRQAFTQSRKLQHAREDSLDVRTAANSTVLAAEEKSVRSELVATQRARDRLQKRLEEVSREAHLGVARLRVAFEQAEAIARRSQEKLLAKLKEAAADREKARLSAVATAEKEMNQLRQEVQVAVDEESRLHKELMKAQQELREAVDAEKKEEASRKADEREVQNMSSELNSMKVQGLANATQLKQQLATRSHADQLEKAELEWKQANATAALAAATEVEKKIRQSRMGLLEQIAELQGSVQQEQKTVVAAKQEARKAKEEADHKVEAERHDQKKREELQRRSAAILQEQARKAQDNLTAAASAGSAAQAQVLALKQKVASMDDKLKMVLAEDGDLRAARDAASKGEAAFQAMDAKAEAALAQQKQSLDSVQRQLQEMRAKYKESEKRSAMSAEQEKVYEAKFLALRNQFNAAIRDANEKMHNTMLTAASKVRELEDTGEILAEDLKLAKTQLSEVSAETAKAKDTLLQETGAALKASQKAEKLNSQLQQVEKSASQYSGKASQLEQAVAKLTAERDRAVDDVEQRNADIADWSSKAETLQDAVFKVTDQTAKAIQENKQLKQEVSQLLGEGHRADVLQAEIDKLHADVQKNASREAQMIEQMDRLKGLKESYSEEYEDEHKESETWEQKAEDLDSKLQAALKEKDALRRTQEAALERVRSARSEEDQYFEENSKLQSQNEALSQKLRDESAAANSSAQDADSLREQVQDLRASEARDEQNSHAAWVANQRELEQAHHDLETAVQLQGNIKSELARTRAVLDDSQRQKLGLAPGQAEQDASGSAAAAQLPPLVATGAGAGGEVVVAARAQTAAPLTAPALGAAEPPALDGQFSTTSFVPFVPEPDLPVTVTLPPALLKDDDDDAPPPTLPPFSANAVVQPTAPPVVSVVAPEAPKVPEATPTAATTAAKMAPVTPVAATVPTAPTVRGAPTVTVAPLEPEVLAVPAAPVVSPTAAEPASLAVPVLPAEPVVPMVAGGPAVPDALTSMVGAIPMQAAALPAIPAVPQTATSALSPPLPSTVAPAQSALLASEPRRPVDDAAALLAGVVSQSSPAAEAKGDKGSTLQRLAAFFASPIQQ